MKVKKNVKKCVARLLFWVNLLLFMLVIAGLASLMAVGIKMSKGSSTLYCVFNVYDSNLNWGGIGVIIAALIATYFALVWQHACILILHEFYDANEFWYDEDGKNLFPSAMLDLYVIAFIIATIVYCCNTQTICSVHNLWPLHLSHGVWMIGGGIVGTTALTLLCAIIVSDGGATAS